MAKNTKALLSLDNFIAKGNMIKLSKDILFITIGLMISSFGTAMFYATALGSNPMATFCDGLHNVLGVSYGAANTLANLLLLGVLLVLKRSYINLGTVLCVLTIGPWVNLFTGILTRLDAPQWHIALRLLCTVVGTILMGVGLGLYVAVDRGFGALEGLVKLLCVKTNISYTWAKILQDVLLVIGGVLLKARFGAGTIIAIFLTGPVLQFSIKYFSRFFKGSAGNGNFS